MIWDGYTLTIFDDEQDTMPLYTESPQVIRSTMFGLVDSGHFRYTNNDNSEYIKFGRQHRLILEPKESN